MSALARLKLDRKDDSELAHDHTITMGPPAVNTEVRDPPIAVQTDCTWENGRKVSAGVEGTRDGPDTVPYCCRTVREVPKGTGSASARPCGQ